MKHQVLLSLPALQVVLITTALALPMMRTAPEECPLQDNNVLDVHLFVTSEDDCKQLCQDDEECVFYHYYQGSQPEQRNEDEIVFNENQILNEGAENQPAQCFLYDACNRVVRSATDDCPLTK